MLMTPLKLIILRIFNVTFGRFSSKLFKKRLIKFLITKKKKRKEKYVATSKYFDLKELK